MKLPPPPCAVLLVNPLSAWTALRRSDGSGLGVACACAVGRPIRLSRDLTVLSVLGFLGVLGVLGVFRRFRRFRRFKRLRPGTRQAWTPIRSH